MVQNKISHTLQAEESHCLPVPLPPVLSLLTSGHEPFPVVSSRVFHPPEVRIYIYIFVSYLLLYN